VKLDILTWGRYRFDSLLQSASSGHSMNCSLIHFRVGFKRETGRLPLGLAPPLNRVFFPIFTFSVTPR